LPGQRKATILSNAPVPIIRPTSAMPDQNAVLRTYPVSRLSLSQRTRTRYSARAHTRSTSSRCARQVARCQARLAARRPQVYRTLAGLKALFRQNERNAIASGTVPRTLRRPPQRSCKPGGRTGLITRRPALPGPTRIPSPGALRTQNEVTP